MAALAPQRSVISGILVKFKSEYVGGQLFVFTRLRFAMYMIPSHE